MQGTLNEIDIRSILQLIQLGQRTGELLVEAYYPNYRIYFQAQRSQGEKNTHNIQSSNNHHLTKRLAWLVFFVNGKITYATVINNNNLTRLQDYLYRYLDNIELKDLEIADISENNSPEYAYLWLLLEKKLLTASQGRSILQNMIQEIIFDLFSLHQGSFIFQMGTPLAPQLVSFDIAPLITVIMKQLHQWKQLNPEIQDPSQCPVITDTENLKLALPENTYKGLYRSCDGQTSLRQIARYINRDVVTIAKAIYPYIEKGWVNLNSNNLDLLDQKNSQLSEINKKPHILCLDDDLTIAKSVEAILSNQGYSITAITEPISAISQILEIKPNLILCDLVMPKLNGYEICSMLRGSSLFKEIPIIILTGKESYINRVQAKLLGATDYLTKPFGKNELLTLVENYLNL